MKKLLIALLLSAGVMSQSFAAVTVFSENFDNLDAWTRKAGYSVAFVSDNVLSFDSDNSAGDIYTTATFSNGSINFDYRSLNTADGGAYVGISEGFPDGHVWLAGSSTSYVTDNPLLNDGNWHHYSVAFTGTGHVMLEQFANGTPGQAMFRNLSVTVSAVPEPETYAMMFAGLALFGFLRRRKSV